MIEILGANTKPTDKEKHLNGFSTLKTISDFGNCKVITQHNLLSPQQWLEVKAFYRRKR